MLDQEPMYESYKDSGELWLGRVPTDWALESIRAVTELKSIRGEPDLRVLSVYRDHGVIPKDSRDDNHNATSLDTSNYKVVEPGDLVVNKMKAWQGSMGVSEYRGIVSPAYITCKTDAEKVVPRFLHYLLRSQPFIAVYNSLSYGVRIGQWDMHYEDFKKIPMAYPDLDTQNRIVSFLDEKTAEIDAAINKKRRLIDLLNEQKAILINRAVTKGLNPDAPMKDSGVDWIGEIPAHWDVKRVKNLFTEINKRSESGQEQHLSMSQKLGLVPSNLVEKSLESESYEGAKLVEEGDLVLNRLKAHLAVFSVAPMIGVISPDYSVFRLRRKDAVPTYFERLFKTPEYLGEFNRKVKGIVVGFYRLYSDDFMAIPLIVPTVEEQKEISRRLEELAAEFTPAFEKVEQEISTLNEFKQTLIANAVTGKIKI